MSNPVTLLCFFSLREGHAIIEPAFQSLWISMLAIGASYTAERGEPQTLFQSEHDTSKFVMIAGYPSLETLVECHIEYGRTYLTQLLELFEQQEAFAIRIDSREIPLADGRITVATYKDEPKKRLPGYGAWDGNEPALQLEAMMGGDASGRPKKWIQIVTTKDASKLEGHESLRNFSLVMESHSS